MLTPPKGSPISGALLAIPSSGLAGRSPLDGAVPAPGTAVQPVSAEGSGSPAQPQVSGMPVLSPAVASGSATSARPTCVPALALAAQHTAPTPASCAASAQPQASNALHASPVGGSLGPCQAFSGSAGTADTAVGPCPVTASRPVSSQSSAVREGYRSPGLCDSSAHGRQSPSFQPVFLPGPPQNASSSVGASPALPVGSAGEGPAEQATPMLAAQGLPIPHSAQASGDASSGPAPPAGSAWPYSPALGFPSVGSTPAVQTIRGICSLGPPMQPQLDPALPPSVPSALGAYMGGQEQHGSPAADVLGSPAMVGSLGVGGTPAADTIKALEAAGQAPASPQSTAWQVKYPSRNMIPLLNGGPPMRSL